LHIIFTGFPYPNGMAGTKRNEHAIRTLADHGARINVLATRQSTKLNPPKGNFSGIEYTTIMPDTLRALYVLKYPLYFFKSQIMFKKIINIQNEKNKLLYLYGPPSLDNITLLLSAKFTGCLIVFDIVEDDNLAFFNSTSYWARVKNIIIRSLTRVALKKADGIIVISSHLKSKVQQIVDKKIPVHLRPISVDFTKFNVSTKFHQDNIDLLYSGSFGKKDGVEFLIEAFEGLAEKNGKISLLLTGMAKTVDSILKKIEESSYKDRILFLGYLSDQEYYSTIMSADILCVPRIDDPYAHAGFPFKLGEFLATGKPVVVSNTGDIELYLEDKESAVLLEPGSAKSISDAVNFLINNPEKSKTIGQKGRDIAKKHFDHISQGNNLFSFLNQLCSKKDSVAKQ
jgi:glycosyltransferase involved in cell wall biosynthesis